MKSNPRVLSALDGLSATSIATIQAAVAKRATNAAKYGAEVNSSFIERCFIEYVEDSRAGRSLEEGLHSREEVVFTRNYAPLYAGGKRTNE
ncbi:MAG TPA: hypothetical protein PLD20_13015 [Blastocatellia bacterium]|nr:hypothetical protein [Blastocatellia bacterium]HMV87204.1 hypothetical protein [Blastocatellia bacterium]HMX25558.1 hypothetical protein [Blastocatellia bacterium]HMY70292.1 hypothetical protein [Blastocatellia bacterium]HMZ18849.1 hypothetical protein [Blastocatellia bacterium]